MTDQMIHHRRISRRDFHTAGALAMALEQYAPAAVEVAPAERLEVELDLTIAAISLMRWQQHP